jgi:transcriptional regulator with XRE-family HTH domain
MKIFGQRLKQLREEKGMSLRELADACNVSKSAIHMYELEKRQPKFETLEMFASIFDTNVEYLLGRTSSRAPIPRNMIVIPDDENPWILKICEIMESSDIDTQIAICQKADSMAQGHQNDGIKEKLLALYDKIEDKEGLIRFIERLSALSVEQQKFVFENLLQGQ